MPSYLRKTLFDMHVGLSRIFNLCHVFRTLDGNAYADHRIFHKVTAAYIRRILGVRTLRITTQLNLTMLFTVHCAIDEPMLLIVSRDFNTDMIYFDCKYLVSFIIYGLLAQNHADSQKIVAKS